MAAHLIQLPWCSTAYLGKSKRAFAANQKFLMDYILKKERTTRMTQSQLHSGKVFIEAGVRSLLRRVHVLVTKEAAGICMRMLALLSMCLLFGSALLMQGTSTAFALQAKAPTDWSFYMYSNSTSTAYSLGCNQGHTDANVHHGSTVVLDFGGQQSNGSGTKMINGNLISNGQIEAVAEAFSHGYWVCTGSDTTTVLDLGIGTNNSLYDVSSSGGRTWVDDVAAIQSSNKITGYYSQVRMYGANDIEPSWSGASAAIAWANGFAGVSGYGYFDYGSADGCPQTSSNNGSCNNGWNQYDVYYVSWGAQPAHPTPEIYYQSQANQWAMISLYGAQHQGGHIVIWGPWDEHDLDTSTFTATQAWDALWYAVNSRSSTAQNFGYSLEIHNE